VPGKVIIITGANSTLGIGRASAHQFAANGAKAIFICDFADDYLILHTREINSLYPDVEVHARKMDAGDEDDVKRVVDEALDKYGRLDVFFANAGILGSITRITESSADDFMKVMRVNALGYVFFWSDQILPRLDRDLIGKENISADHWFPTLSVFLAAKHAGKAMSVTSKDKPYPSGSIIGTASTAGLRSNAGATDYSASKAAVISIMQTAAYQLSGTGIRCNAVCPGIIETGMTSKLYEMARSRGTERKIGQLNPLMRGAVADEVARVALFLGSDDASYVNGQAWAVDGGLSAGHPFVPGKMA